MMTTLSNPAYVRIPGYPHLKNTLAFIRLAGYGNYSYLHLLKQERPLVISKTLKQLEQTLPTFIRVNKTDIVNPAYIAQVIRQSSLRVYLVLTDGTQLTVSRRRIPLTLEKVDQYRQSLAS